MPAISTGDAALLRQFPQTVRRYLSVAPRDAVFAAQVSSGTIQRDAVSSGVIAIPYTQRDDGRVHRRDRRDDARHRHDGGRRGDRQGAGTLGERGADFDRRDGADR